MEEKKTVEVPGYIARVLQTASWKKRVGSDRCSFFWRSQKKTRA